MQDILNGLPSGRRTEIEARTEALRQALIEGEESGGTRRSTWKKSGAKHEKTRR